MTTTTVSAQAQSCHTVPFYTVVNLALFNAGWFACVLPAAAGYPWIGVAAVAALATFHVLQSRERSFELRLIAIAAVVGFGLDSALVLSSVLSFPEPAQLGSPSTLWMAAMWANFATALRASLGWLRPRLAVAGVFGAIGGPLAYFAGEKLGAVNVDGGVAGWIAIGVEWTVAMVFLVYLAGRPDRVRD